MLYGRFAFWGEPPHSSYLATFVMAENEEHSEEKDGEARGPPARTTSQSKLGGLEPRGEHESFKHSRQEEDTFKKSRERPPREVTRRKHEDCVEWLSPHSPRHLSRAALEPRITYAALVA